uniref:GPN-loop GTPase n=1 Tax=Spongospora subterranea TaxID=70186 RepID=A0A0H5RA08_9EUKA|eukprot:CRZ10918.1 hypothetical protein [Spongospora subterranea]
MVADGADTASSSPAPATKPTTCIVIGMAGSGKTTFMQRIVSHLAQKNRPSYILNLDPAVSSVPYRVNIDIRDTVDYKSVMENYKLGPNGAIVTSLNLFSTRFDQVVDHIEKAASTLDYVFIDTPGQIEVFTWSASGQIITESLASSCPTVIVYVIDTPRSQSAATFMSNMTYACSIMYKTKLPFLIVFNKIDVVSHQFAEDWMNDIELFEEALQSEKTFMSTLTRSLAFVMEEFYKNIKCVGVSSMTGQGIDEFFTCLDTCVEEYASEYLPFLEERMRERQEEVNKITEQRVEQAKAQMAAPDVVIDAAKSPLAPIEEEPECEDSAATDSNDEPFDNFDYEQDRRDFEEYMAVLRDQQEKTV